MNLRVSGGCALAAVVVACLLGSPPSLAQNAYITNEGSGTVSVIDTASNTVSATIPVGILPVGVAVSPDGSHVYVANLTSFPSRVAGSVSVIATASNTVIATIPVGIEPVGVAVSPDGRYVYVANEGSGTVSVIATASNTVTATIPDVGDAFSLAVSPDGATSTAPRGRVSR